MAGHTPVEQVQSVVVQITHHIDAKNWTGLRALYAGQVETDYTSLGGGRLEEPGDALVQRWKAGLGNVITQHLLGPIDVTLEGDRARAECHVQALHFASGLPGGDRWAVFGHYVIDLARSEGRWLIEKMLLQTTKQEGNTKLLAEASR